MEKLNQIYGQETAYIQSARKGNSIQISMDGRGRCLDNILVERLWRTVKQENIYLNSYQNVLETKIGLNEYFSFYNNFSLINFPSPFNDLCVLTNQTIIPQPSNQPFSPHSTSGVFLNLTYV
ncbi:MAG TPA: hypothetical protein DEF59_00290 [Candidatus Magasanikbacteria bacterium]|nr:hypothetical protein [Candidatus Magasanikbacteria bacterium]